MVALVLLSASTLAFELLLTKFFACKFDYHFTFAIISITLLGFGAAGVFTQLRAGAASALGPVRLARYALAYSPRPWFSGAPFARGSRGPPCSRRWRSRRRPGSWSWSR